MPIARPTGLQGAVEALGAWSGATVLGGGTDLMIEIAYGELRPRNFVALRRVEELKGYELDDEELELRAMLTYTEMENELREHAPGLAMVAATVGSPQIRNAGTIGGNVGTASPAGDTLPWLLALDAEVTLVSTKGARRLHLADFIRGPKSTGLGEGEVIVSLHVPRTYGPQHSAKIGARNAMVISIAVFSLIVDVHGRRIRAGMGAVGPVPLRPKRAEKLASEAVDWQRLTCPEDAVEAFAVACAEATEPITDHRGTAEYRRHAIRVLAARSMRRCLRS